MAIINNLLYCGGGGGGYEEEIIARTISAYENSTIETIGDYAFYHCEMLSSISCNSCTSIGSNAFAYCSALSTISFPMCETIGTSAFYNCTMTIDLSSAFPECKILNANALGLSNTSSLKNHLTDETSISMSNVTSIGNYVFYGLSELENISFPKCETIGTCAFYNAFKLSIMSFPECTSIEYSAFAWASNGSYENLTGCVAYFPECEYIGAYAFNACHSSAIKRRVYSYMYFPKVKTISSSAFLSASHVFSLFNETLFPECSVVGESAFMRTYFGNSTNKWIFPKIEIIRSRAFAMTDFSCFKLGTNIRSIYSSAFWSCVWLNDIYLGSTSAAYLENSNVFYTTKIGNLSTTAHIYVPNSLIATYKTKTNWTYFSTLFKSATSFA